MNIIIGQRGCGKTFQAKKWAIKKFIETGDPGYDYSDLSACFSSYQEAE